ncbi:hypothetical protein BaRGS_00006886 [Batillaria attramentaria]|uniref:TNFR-Cys domain-containing protein n=1 Tax=Batillaria attramentaria TaxID=370345 RepID=A0ABD0LQE8_9CAEN
MYGPTALTKQLAPLTGALRVLGREHVISTGWAEQISDLVETLVNSRRRSTDDHLHHSLPAGDTIRGHSVTDQWQRHRRSTQTFIAGREHIGTYVSPERINCIPCPPGQKVLEHCTKNAADSTCVPCEKFHYSDTHNPHKYCKLCKSSCPKNGYENLTCSTSSNRVCWCHEGFHRHPLDPFDPFFECVKHSQCAEDEGVESQGNFWNDTICRKCIKGVEFIDRSDADNPMCKKCQRCPDDQEEVSPCTLSADRQCPSPGISAFNGTSTTELNQAEKTPEANSSSSGDDTGLILGLTFGILVMLVGIVLAVYCRRRSQNAAKEREKQQQQAAIYSSNQTSDTAITSTDQTAAVQPLLQNDDTWEENFIKRTVFLHLPKLMGTGWEIFIEFLPGEWTTTRVRAVIEQSKQDATTTEEQIRSCLSVWARECPTHLNKASIFSALEHSQLNHLQQELDGL